MMARRRLIIERPAPFRRGFLVRAEPMLVGDAPQKFITRAEALNHALAMQKTDGFVVVDQSA